jgi:hypothetical protein
MEPRAGRHFRIRNAEQWVSLVEEVTRISTLGIPSLDVELSPMIRELEL